MSNVIGCIFGEISGGGPSRIRELRSRVSQKRQSLVDKVGASSHSNMLTMCRNIISAVHRRVTIWFAARS